MKKQRGHPPDNPVVFPMSHGEDYGVDEWSTPMESRKPSKSRGSTLRRGHATPKRAPALDAQQYQDTARTPVYIETVQQYAVKWLQLNSTGDLPQQLFFLQADEEGQEDVKVVEIASENAALVQSLITAGHAACVVHWKAHRHFFAMGLVTDGKSLRVYVADSIEHFGARHHPVIDRMSVVAGLLSLNMEEGATVLSVPQQIGSSCGAHACFNALAMLGTAPTILEPKRSDKLVSHFALAVRTPKQSVFDQMASLPKARRADKGSGSGSGDSKYEYVTVESDAGAAPMDVDIAQTSKAVAAVGGPPTPRTTPRPLRRSSKQAGAVPSPEKRTISSAVPATSSAVAAPPAPPAVSVAELRPRLEAYVKAQVLQTGRTQDEVLVALSADLRRIGKVASAYLAAILNGSKNEFMQAKLNHIHRFLSEAAAEAGDDDGACEEGGEQEGEGESDGSDIDGEESGRGVASDESSDPRAAASAPVELSPARTATYSRKRRLTGGDRNARPLKKRKE